MKMSKSEAGKLGAEKSKIFSAMVKQNNINEYLKNPNFCENCHKIISYEQRYQKFCSSSCSATFNNVRRLKKEKNVCLNCGSEIDNSRKYCSNSCQQSLKTKKRLESWKNGNNIHKQTIKKFLAEKREGCWECGITTWNNKSLVLELEHVDGNSDNNAEENLSLLCPNCHSQTDTYKGKNKGNGRHYRRQRYKDGKSY